MDKKLVTALQKNAQLRRIGMLQRSIAKRYDSGDLLPHWPLVPGSMPATFEHLLEIEFNEARSGICFDPYCVPVEDVLQELEGRKVDLLNC